MYYTLKIRGELRPVNTLHTLVVREDPSSYGSSPPSIPPDEAHARHIAQQSVRWYAFATQRTRQRPATLLRKAMESACYSTAKRASSLAVPTKLCSVRAHQRTIWTQVRNRVPAWAPLELEIAESDISVFIDGELIGCTPSKHRGWLKPLIPFGARLYISKIKGTECSGYTLSVHVVIGHVGEALDRLLNALGEAGVSGGGAGDDGLGTGADLGGDGAANTLRLLKSPPALSLGSTATSEADPADVVLFRDVDGTAKATVQHIPLHSHAIEWGYHGSGPADLSRSILLAFTDEATANRLYERYKAEVIAAVPKAGGVIRAAEVSAWLAGLHADSR